MMPDLIQIKFNPEPRFASVGHVVREFGLSANTWRRLADTGQVVVKRVRSYRFIERASAYAYLYGPERESPPTLPWQKNLRNTSRAFFAGLRQEAQQPMQTGGRE